MFTFSIDRRWFSFFLLIGIFLTGCASDLEERVNTLETNLATSQAELAAVKDETTTTAVQTDTLQTEIAANATLAAAANQTANEAINSAQAASAQVAILENDLLALTPESPLATETIPLTQGGINMTYLDAENIAQVTWFHFDDVQQYPTVFSDFMSSDAWGSKHDTANVVLAWSGSDTIDSSETPTGQLLYSTEAFSPTVPVSQVNWAGYSLSVQAPITDTSTVAIPGQIMVQGDMLPSVTGYSPFTSTGNSLITDLGAVATTLGLADLSQLEDARPLFLLVQDLSSGQADNGTYTLVIIAQEVSVPDDIDDPITAVTCMRATSWWRKFKCHLNGFATP